MTTLVDDRGKPAELIAVTCEGCGGSGKQRNEKCGPCAGRGNRLWLVPMKPKPKPA